MKKLLFTVISTLVISLGTVKSQSMFEFAAGVRAGYPNGLTAKLFLSDAGAVEGIAHFYFGGGVGVTGLYEHHIEILQVPALNFFFGGGLSTTAYNGSVDNIDPYVAVGIEGITGVEYTFEDFPLNVSVDVKPTVNVIGFENTPFLPSAGVSARYIFK